MYGPTLDHGETADGRRPHGEVVTDTLARYAAVRGHQPEAVPLQQADVGVLGPTDSGGALGDRVQHRLQLGRRAGDDAEHPGGRGLLLQRLEQPAAQR